MEPSAGGGMRSWFTGLPAPGRAVKWIAIINIAMFVICLATGGAEGLIFRTLEMRTDLVLRGQIWRIVTFTYLHDQGSLGHLFWNMLGLYFLGMSLEQHLGAKRFFWFYSAAGLAAGLMYFVVTLTGWLDPHIPIVGASGGVLGVLGACAVLFPHLRLVLVFFLVPIRTAALIFGAFFLFSLVTRGANAGGEACHLAGLAFGIAYGYRGFGWERKIQQWRDDGRRREQQSEIRAARALEQEVDQILEKVHRTGINSLTRREKQILEEASRRDRR